MKKMILSVAVVFAMSSLSAFAQDTKPAKKEAAKTEQCCKKDAADKKECCKKDAAATEKKACCQKEEGKKKEAPKAKDKK
ncbi:MAG: hypothetical protein LBN11_02245 [Tannerella sp.]|jgi:hypothetical protein|nr:hypothetical protein [Tannerella sp.]